MKRELLKDSPDIPVKVEEASPLAQSEQKYNSDLQNILDRVKKVFEQASSQADWDEHPELDDDAWEHIGDDVTEFPDG